MMRSGLQGELFPLYKNIIPFKSVVPIMFEWGENGRLKNPFEKGMFGNFLMQDKLYHYFGVPTNRSTIYVARKRKKKTIWNLMARRVLDVINLFCRYMYLLIPFDNILCILTI